MPQATENHPLEGVLVYEDSLPVAWEARPKGEEKWELTKAAEQNGRLLRYANLLGEQHRERQDDETEADSRLSRIESKVDLLLDLFSHLLEQRGAELQVAQVRLSGAGIEWLCAGAAPGGDASIWVKLLLERRLPGVLRIPAKVLAVTEEGAGFRVTAEFQSMGEGVQDLLEKLIFRHHRRQVAQSRPGAQQG